MFTSKTVIAQKSTNGKNEAKRLSISECDGMLISYSSLPVLTAHNSCPSMPSCATASVPILGHPGFSHSSTPSFRNSRRRYFPTLQKPHWFQLPEFLCFTVIDKMACLQLPGRRPFRFLQDDECLPALSSAFLLPALLPLPTFPQGLLEETFDSFSLPSPARST